MKVDKFTWSYGLPFVLPKAGIVSKERISAF
jgi:hypothetical protein